MKHYIKNIGTSNLSYANNIATGEFYEFFDDTTFTFGVNIGDFRDSFFTETGIGKDIVDSNVEYYQNSTLTSFVEFYKLWPFLHSLLKEVSSTSGDVPYSYPERSKLNNIALTQPVDFDSIASSLPIEGEKIQKVKFNLTQSSILEEGELAYNPYDFTLELKTAIGTLQIGQEHELAVINHTATPLLDGRVVRVTGYNGSHYQVEYADCNSLEGASWDGVLKETIESGSVGKMTIIGIIHNYNTLSYSENDDLYLTTDGQMSNIEPANPCYVRKICTVGKISETEGELFVRWEDGMVGDNKQKFVDGNMPHGIPRSQKDLIVMTYDSSTQTITFNGTFYIYNKSCKYIINWSDETLVHDDISGTYFIYIDFDVDNNVVLTSSSTPWEFGDIIPLALVVYNNDPASTYWTGPKGKLLCERHGCEMDKATHSELHNTIGAWTSDAFTLAGYLQGTGTGTLAANTFSIDGGTMYDEDNKTLLPSLADNDGVGNVYNVWYREGTEWKWYENNVPYLFETTNILYNPISAGSGSLVQITNNGYFVNMWLVATPELNSLTGTPSSNGFALIIGQIEHTSIDSARSESFYEVDLGGYPGQEVAPLYQIIFQRQNTYADTGNCRIEEVRKISGTRYSSTTSGVSPSVHNNLALRDALATHPASSITNSPTGNLSATTVQGALNELQIDIDGLDLSLHSVTELNDVTDAGSGSIITTIERGKLDNITITQPVDLDTLESDVAINNTKETNVTTDLSIDNITNISLDILSSDGTDVTIPAVTTTTAGLLTGTDKTKLNTIEEGAEVNVNADWDSVSGDSQILNKPTDLTDLSTHSVTELNDITDAGSGSVITTTERDKLNNITVTKPINLDEVGDVVDLLTLSDTEPVASSIGQKYFNTTDSKIYTWDGSTWSSPVDPLESIIYVAVDTTIIYRWNSIEMVDLNQQKADKKTSILTSDQQSLLKVDSEGNYDYSDIYYVKSSAEFDDVIQNVVKERYLINIIGTVNRNYASNYFSFNANTLEVTIVGLPIIIDYTNFHITGNNNLKLNFISPLQLTSSIGNVDFNVNLNNLTLNILSIYGSNLNSFTFDVTGTTGVCNLQNYPYEGPAQITTYTADTNGILNLTNWYGSNNPADQVNPGLNKYYGTDNTGKKYWGSIADTIVNLGFVQTLSKTLTLDAPTASDNITFFRTDVDISVQEIIAVSTGTTPSTTYQLKHSPDRSATGNFLTSGAQTTTSITTGDVADLGDFAIPANSWVWLETTAASGTDVILTIDVRYTED